MTLRLALLLALLPGLLFSSGVSGRICLHALVGAQAECGPCSAERPPCCGGEERPEGPSFGAHEDCASCCVELEAAAQRLGSSERIAGTASLPPPAPVAFALVTPDAASPADARPTARATPRASPAGRGILPLRI